MSEEQVPVDPLKKTSTKVPWTLERCSKVARRFQSEQEWQKGHPSSYKAANSRGFLAGCLKAQKAHWAKSTAKKLPEPPKKSA